MTQGDLVHAGGKGSLHCGGAITFATDVSNHLHQGAQHGGEGNQVLLVVLRAIRPSRYAAANTSARGSMPRQALS